MGTSTPLEYRSCDEYEPSLKAGDKLDFKVEDSNAGTFTIGEMPQNDAVLQLVISRHDTLSSSVQFQSHVFANVASTQIAVLDTYQGAAKSEVRIVDVHPQHPGNK